MSSLKSDQYFIEQDLVNARRIMEKSVEQNRKLSRSGFNFPDRPGELAEKLRNEEYLKLSYEKALKEKMVLLKEEQDKNLALEKRIAGLEALLEARNFNKIEKLSEKIDELEKTLKINKPESFSIFSKRSSLTLPSPVHAKEGTGRSTETRCAEKINKIEEKISKLQKALALSGLTPSHSTKVLKKKLVHAKSASKTLVKKKK